jgi:Acetyltransferases
MWIKILCGHDGRRGLIHHLGVDIRYRRLGIGKKLMQISLGQLKAQGIKKCTLFVLKGNDIGESFYKSLQWKEEDIVKIYAKVL